MNQILLVEGNDELHVFSNIFKEHNIEKSFKIKDTDGIENLLKAIPISIKTGVSTLGIVVDANSNITKRWNSIKNILTEHGYKVPDNPAETGTNLEMENLPDVGIWIMPNNKENGMLEDFMKYLIPENDPLLPEVETTLSLIEEKELNKYKPIHKPKAKIHTWLAWQENPGTPLGLAITKKYFNNTNLCNTFVNWIKTTYKLSDVTIEV